MAAGIQALRQPNATIADQPQLVTAHPGCFQALVNAVSNFALRMFQVVRDFCVRLFQCVNCFGDRRNTNLVRLEHEAETNLNNRAFAVALTQYREMLRAQRAIHGNAPHLSVEQAMLGVANCLRGLERPQECLEQLQEALSLRIRRLGADHLELAELHVHIGMELQRQGQHVNASQAFDAASRIYTLHRREGSRAFYSAHATSHLAVANNDLDREEYRDAIDHLNATSRIYLERLVFDEDNIAVREVNQKLAGAHLQFGRGCIEHEENAEGIDHLDIARNIYRERLHLTETDPRIRQIDEVLAEAHARVGHAFLENEEDGEGIGHLDTAREIYTERLELEEADQTIRAIDQSLAEVHARVGHAAANNREWALCVLHLEAARNIYVQHLRLREADPIVEGIDAVLAPACDRLGQADMQEENFRAAAFHFAQALQIYTELLGIEAANVQILRIQEDLARSNTSSGIEALAREAFVDAIEQLEASKQIYTQRLGRQNNDPVVQDITRKLAEAYFKRGEECFHVDAFADAVQILTQASELYRGDAFTADRERDRWIKRNDLQLVNALQRQGEGPFAQARYEEALRSFSEAINILERLIRAGLLPNDPHMLVDVDMNRLLSQTARAHVQLATAAGTAVGGNERYSAGTYEHLKKARELYEAGDDHVTLAQVYPLLADTAYNRATYFQNNARLRGNQAPYYSNAIELFEYAMEIYEERLHRTANNPALVQVYNGLAQSLRKRALYCTRGGYSLATSLRELERANEIYRDKLGLAEDSPERVAVREEIARISA